MKQHNKIKRLRARQEEYAAMLKNASMSDVLFLEKSHRRPGSVKK